jgi:hypothetical protein
MFQLTLVDHLRLTFGHVIYAHRAHSELALRHARWNRWLLATEALLMLGAALASIALVTTGQAVYGVVAAVAAVIAVGALVIRLVFDFDRRASAHRTCSARLWKIREQYRALIADLRDETLTLDAARARRDALMEMLHGVYDNAPPAERSVYAAARQALPGTDEDDLTDEEINQFLPASLQKGGTPAPSPTSPQ